VIKLNERLKRRREVSLVFAAVDRGLNWLSHFLSFPSSRTLRFGRLNPFFLLYTIYHAARDTREA